MAMLQVKQDQLALRLAGMVMPAECSEARSAALARLQATGLPGRRDEYWRYTDPASLVTPEVNGAADVAQGETPLFDGIDRVRLVFVDGVFDPAASDDLAMAGLTISLLTQVGTNSLYGTLEAQGQSPVARPLAAMNTAFAPEGVLIHVTGQAAR
ncbi:MAG: Fe-S cluster assembly protein SufD, partial [Candidatus Saccharibacteria bacterium]|nr:Fe-S cluster assembly protein SufD [Pseudorhodobacter sp.]